MYEKRCAVIVADERANADAVKSPEVYDMTPTMGGTSPPTTSRRHSTDVSPNLTVDLPRTSKLTMRDFLIMPIQRICRYPLMLRQLQLNGGLASPPASPTLNTSAIASTSTLGINMEAQALDAMKQVAAKVDEARRRTDVAIKSRLIVERISDQVCFGYTC
jgi:RhoGEF domain